MKYIIKANNKPVASVTGLGIDETMGVQNGKFVPLDGYKEIEKQIKTYSKLVFDLNMNDVNDNNEYRYIVKEIESFNIKAFNENGYLINFSKIDLRDYSDDLDDEGYNVIFYP